MITAPTAYGMGIEADARYSPRSRPWFDFGRYWAGGKQPTASLRAYWKKVDILGRSPVPMTGLMGIKARILTRFEDRLPDPVYRLAAGAVLGDRGPVRLGSYKDRPIRRLFAHAGIAHVLAVSGLHVGTVCAGLIGLLRLCRVPKRWMVLPVGSGLVIFLLLTGARPATARAVLMAIIGLAAYGIGRRGFRRSAWTGVSAAATILLLYQPLLLKDAGFQLSFGAVLSLLCLTRPIGRFLRKLSNPALVLWVLSLAIMLWAASTHMAFLCSRPGLATLGCSAGC